MNLSFKTQERIPENREKYSKTIHIVNARDVDMEEQITYMVYLGKPSK